MSRPGAPLLYEVAARPWLARLSARHGRRVTLGDVPELVGSPFAEAKCVVDEDELVAPGLYLDLPADRYHLFRVNRHAG